MGGVLFSYQKSRKERNISKEEEGLHRTWVGRERVPLNKFKLVRKHTNKRYTIRTSELILEDFTSLTYYIWTYRDHKEYYRLCNIVKFSLIVLKRQNSITLTIIFEIIIKINDNSTHTILYSGQDLLDLIRQNFSTRK